MSTPEMHELIFTDRDARPATWRTRCLRDDVPLERAIESPSPSHHYQVTCPACLRIAELEADLIRIGEAVTALRDDARRYSETATDYMVSVGFTGQDEALTAVLSLIDGAA